MPEPNEIAISNAYRIPHVWSATITTGALDAWLQRTGGWIMANGQMWDIVSEAVTPNTHRVRLEQR